MKVIWLGQNGFLFVSGKNKVLVDPYLSDSLKELDIRMERGWSINRKFLEVEPDVIVLTNSHMDHTDIATLKNYIDRNKYQTTVLCCESAFNMISASRIIGRYNNVLMESGSQWTHDNLVFEAVPAKTDDKTAIGIIITDKIENKKYYITSDTLYNKNIFKHIPRDIDTLFLPINGEDGGMNMDDALRFAKEIDALHTVPVHFGMFDDINPKKFKFDGAVIPEIYRIIPLSVNDRSEFRRISLRKVLAREERDMKTRLSEKPIKVENSRIIPEPKAQPTSNVSSVEGHYERPVESPVERPVEQAAEMRQTNPQASVKPTVKVTNEKVYDPLPAREAGVAYLQALKERQRAKDNAERAIAAQENRQRAVKEAKSVEPVMPATPKEKTAVTQPAADAPVVSPVITEPVGEDVKKEEIKPVAVPDAPSKPAAQDPKTSESKEVSLTPSATDKDDKPRSAQPSIGVKKGETKTVYYDTENKEAKKPTFIYINRSDIPRDVLEDRLNQLAADIPVTEEEKKVDKPKMVTDEERAERPRFVEPTIISREEYMRREEKKEEKKQEEQKPKQVRKSGMDDTADLAVVEEFDFTGEVDVSFVKNFTSADYADMSSEFKAELPDDSKARYYSSPKPVDNGVEENLIPVIEEIEESSENNEPKKEKTAEKLDDVSENKSNAPWSFDPFSVDDFDKTLDIDSARGAVALETLESIQEISEEYDNLNEEDSFEPYDDREGASSDEESAEILDDVDESDDENVGYDLDDADDIDADVELIYSDDKDGEIDIETFEDEEDDDTADKIDAYIKELEKFERGDTADFSSLEF